MNQLAQKTHIPWWLTLIIFMEVWPMFLGPYWALTDPTFFGTPESTTTILGDWIYTARNLAVGFALILAFYLKNAPMLFILIFIRLFTDFGKDCNQNPGIFNPPAIPPVTAFIFS